VTEPGDEFLERAPREAGAAAFDRALRDLADAYGVQTSFTDVNRERRRAGRRALYRVLRALGAPFDRPEELRELLSEAKHRRSKSRAFRGRRRHARDSPLSPGRQMEPVVVAWDGLAPKVPFRLDHAADPAGLQAVVELEDGRSIRAKLALRWVRSVSMPEQSSGNGEIRVDGPLPPGYHRLRLSGPGLDATSLIVAAPRRAPALHARSWGTFLPLYSLRTGRGWGVGSFTELAELYRWTGSLGGSTVGTLPLLAQFLEEPFEYSPYAPASRMFWNELFIDVEAVPELARSDEARDRAARTDTARLRRGRLVDYRKTYGAKRPVLGALAGEFFERETGSARRRAFERYRRETPNLDDYARFRAFGEKTRQAWHEWPARQRGGRLTGRDVDPGAVRFHQYVQFVADEQLGAVGKTAPGRGLFLDLPLGVNGASYDTWRFRDSFAEGVSGGVPPDTFFTRGQNWGFPPLHPRRIRDEGYAYVRYCLRHLLKHAGVIRIDHVMGFHRLYWIPDGMGPTDGVYARYPAEELYAVLSLEAHRAGAAVVGEDLGTVPPLVRTAMARHGVLRSHVAELEALSDRRPPLPPAPKDSLAGLNTHDLATFASFWEGRDVDDRLDLGLIDELEARRQRAERARLTRLLTGQFRAEGHLPSRGPKVAPTAQAAAAAHAHLAVGPASMQIVNLEDLWGETDPQNRPGTYRDQPNWRRRAARTFEGVRSDPEILGRLEEVNRLRSEAAARERRGPGHRRRVEEAST
jgi:4-alpha-glucanotransferase